MEVCPLPAEVARPHGKGEGMVADVDDGAEQVSGAWLPAGPSTVEEVWDWAPSAIDSLLRSHRGDAWTENLANLFRNGLQLNTDFSGMGCPEMSLTMIHDAWRACSGGDTEEADSTGVCFWRGSDILPFSRRVLRGPRGSASAGRGGPQHVFGDVLERLPPKTRRKLQLAHKLGEQRFENTRASSEDGKVPPAAVEAIGAKMIDEMVAIMQGVQFSLDATAWCYKCRKHCRVHGPAEVAPARLSRNFPGRCKKTRNFPVGGWYLEALR